MALVVTDAIDPGPPQCCDGIAPGIGPGTAATGGTAGLKTLKQKLLTLTYSGTYSTGGSTITVAQMADLNALFAHAMGVTSGYVLVPVYNNDGTLTVKLFWRAGDNAAGGEVTDTTAISFTARLLVMGREA